MALLRLGAAVEPFRVLLVRQEGAHKPAAAVMPFLLAPFSGQHPLHPVPSITAHTPSFSLALPVPQ